MSEELKECQCGSKQVNIDYAKISSEQRIKRESDNNYDPYLYMAVCSNLHSDGIWRSSEREAIEAWERRAGDE